MEKCVSIKQIHKTSAHKDTLGQTNSNVKAETVYYENRGHGDGMCILSDSFFFVLFF